MEFVFNSSTPAISGRQQAAVVIGPSNRSTEVRDANLRSMVSSTARNSSSRPYMRQYAEPPTQNSTKASRYSSTDDDNNRRQHQRVNMNEPEMAESRRRIETSSSNRNEAFSASPSLGSIDGCSGRGSFELVQGLPPVARTKSNERSTLNRSCKLPVSSSCQTSASPRKRHRRSSSAFRVVSSSERQRRNSSSGSESSPSRMIYRCAGDGQRPAASPSVLSSRETLMSSRSFRPIETAGNVFGPVENPIPRRPLPRGSIAECADAESNSINASGSSTVRRGSSPNGFDSVRLESRSLPLLCRTPLVVTIVVVTFLSPVVMLSLSVIRSLFDDDDDRGQRMALKCLTTDCQSSVMLLAVRLTLAALCLVAAFVRCNAASTCCDGRRQRDPGGASRTTLPRLETIEVGLVGLMALDAIVFWSFYVVRVMTSSATGSDGRRDDAVADFERTLSFATSMADSLVFVVGLTILFAQLGVYAVTSSYDDERSACSGEACYGVRILRSSDGWSATFTVGETSIQRLALHCLRRQSSVHGDAGLNVKVPISGTGDQFYEPSDVASTSSVRTVNTWSGLTLHEQRRRVARRRARLLAATEEAYSRRVLAAARITTRHTNRLFDNRSDGNEDHSVEAGLIRPDEAAAEGVCMAVHGYMKAIGQRHLYNRQEILDRLEWCLTNGASTEIFIHKYLCLEQSELPSDPYDDHGHCLYVTGVLADNGYDRRFRNCNGGDGGTETWTLSCTAPANSSIGDGTHFILRECVDGIDDVITGNHRLLTVEVRQMPSYKLVPLRRLHVGSDTAADQSIRNGFSW